MYKTNHYWRIHRRVSRRVLLEISPRMRTIIANDADHTTPEYKWFEQKVNTDTKRLYEDANHWDNQVHDVVTEDGKLVSLWQREQRF